MGGKCQFGRGEVCKFITTALALYPDFTQFAPFCRKGPFQRKSPVCDDSYCDVFVIIKHVIHTCFMIMKSLESTFCKDSDL